MEPDSARFVAMPMDDGTQTAGQRMARPAATGVGWSGAMTIEVGDDVAVREPGAEGGSRSRLGRFAGDESGAMVIFGLFLLVLMLMVGGMAVDFMNGERQRAAMQQTMDSSLLAAASLRRTLPPEEVVDDFWLRSGKADMLQSRGADVDLNGKSVWANAEAEVPTVFMHMLDVNTLKYAARGRAEESVGNVEISLVLDISGSMRFGDQIGKLRVAAKEFFTTILSGESASTTSINVVPYAGQVSVGPTLFSRFGGVRRNGDAGAPDDVRASCLDMTAADYANANPPASGRPQTAKFMNWTIDRPTMNWGWCPTDNSQILIAQNDLAKLNGFIDGIRLHDGTGTQTGVKYGLMLLNPAMRPHFQAMGGAEVPTQFRNRPLNWPTERNADVSKYLIVMTDGEITEQVRPRFTGWIDRDADDKDNEVYNGVKDPDLIDGTDYDIWNGQKIDPNLSIEKDKKGNDIPYRGTELQNQPSSNRTGDFTSRASNVQMFTYQCNLAKQNGIIVYTIAFNAGANAADQMRACASHPGYFFQVDGTQKQIRDAFQSIARSIRQLRLTQ